jgi:hypothetical protein
MTAQSSSLKIWWPLRIATGLVAVLDLVIGLVFVVSPETGFAPWPSALPSTITRFIGAIVFANGVGAVMLAWDGGWEHARALFAVALVYGLVTFIALPVDLLLYQKDLILWIYEVVTLIFAIPIVIIVAIHEYQRWRLKQAS